MCGPLRDWWPQLVWVSIAAVVMDLGRFHQHHTADSLVPVLASLYRWTAFYWEQNRYGLLVQLLAVPFAHPLTNLLVQNGVTIWAGLMAFPLAARYLVRHESWAAAGPLAAGTFVLLAPVPLQWAYFSTFNVFPVSLALALAGLLALERPRPWHWLLAAVAFALAAWVNAAIAVLMLPVVLAAGVSRLLTDATPRRQQLRELVPAVGLVGLTYPLAKVLMRIPPPEFRTTWVSVPPVGTWASLARTSAADFWQELSPGVWLGFLAAVAFWLVVVAVGRKDARGNLLRFALLVVALGGYMVLMAVLFKGRWRYGTPALVLLHAAAVTAVVRLVPFRRWLVAAGGLGVVLATVVTFGPPSVEQVRRDVRQPAHAPADFAECVRVLAAEDCTHVAGDYWFVWPAVFVRNLDAADTGEGPRLWGLSHRSWPTRPQWSAVPAESRRIAFRTGDESAAAYLAQYGLRTRLLRESGPLQVHVMD